MRVGIFTNSGAHREKRLYFNNLAAQPWLGAQILATFGNQLARKVLSTPVYKLSRTVYTNGLVTFMGRF